MPLSATWLPGISLRLEPGNGTRYDLVIVKHPYGGWILTWCDACWLGLYLPGRWAELRTYAGKLGKADREAILSALAVMDLGKTCRSPVESTNG